MKANAILINGKDNVVTVLKETQKGEEITYFSNGELCSVTAAQNVPAYHKMALVPVKKDELIFKYGEIIGCAMEDIAAGGHVSHANIKSLPRDYASELQ